MGFDLGFGAGAGAGIARVVGIAIRREVVG